ncbi:hypothetical protein T4E_6699, partial [Trichinella pseudospiralis]
LFMAEVSTCVDEKNLSLLDRKRQQWAKERAETEEWFPFGKPGSGAPLKSRNDLPLRNSPYTSNNGCFAGDVVNNREINFPNKSVDSTVNQDKSCQVFAQAPVVNLSERKIVGPGFAGVTPVAFIPVPCTNLCADFGQNCFPSVASPLLTNVNALGNQFSNGGKFPTSNSLQVDTGNNAVRHDKNDLLQSASYPLDQCNNFNSCAGTQSPVGSFPYNVISNASVSSSCSAAATNGLRQNYILPPFQDAEHAFTYSPVSNANACMSPTTFNGPKSPYNYCSTPNSSKPQSLSGIEPYDMSGNSFGASIFSCSYPGALDDFTVHKRRNLATEPISEQEIEMKRRNALKQRIIFDEQIQQKQREKLLEIQREKQEQERVERERREMERRRQIANARERERWAKLKEEEERREKCVLESWQKAKEEASKLKHARLLQHSASRSPDDGDDEMIFIPGYQQPHCVDEIGSSFGNMNLYSSSGRFSFSNSNSENFAHGQPCYSSIRERSNFSSPDDDRPIKPLMQNPLDMWEELISKQKKKKNKQKMEINEQLSSKDAVEQQRDCVTNSSVILRRAVSDATVTPKTRSKYSLQTSIVRPLLRKSKENTGDSSKSIQEFKKAEKKKNNKKKKGSTSSSVATDDTSESSRTRGNSKMDAASNFFNKLSKSFHHISPRNRTTTPLSSTVSTSQTENNDNRDSLFIPDNPWGDQLGGANPLFQPLMTRSRKPKKIFEQQQSSTTNLHQTTVNSNVDEDAESKLNDCAENGLLSENQFQRSPSLRIPTESNFTYKSQKYRSISAKLFQPSESHRNLVERLLQLRKLLKEKNKELESIVLKPINSSEPNAKH